MAHTFLAFSDRGKGPFKRATPSSREYEHRITGPDLDPGLFFESVEVIWVNRAALLQVRRGSLHRNIHQSAARENPAFKSQDVVFRGPHVVALSL
jgi:hypothetical protein